MGSDSFAEAPALLGRTGFSFATDTTKATAEPGEPAHAESAAAHSVWWKYTAPTNGVLIVDTFLSADDFDTTLGVYTGSVVSALTEVASNDEFYEPSSIGSHNSKVSLPVLYGTTYWIAVDGFMGDTGDAIVRWEFIEDFPLGSDHLEYALKISGSSGLSGATDTTTATAEQGEPTHAGEGAFHSVWWKYVAPSNGVMFLDTFLSDEDFDTTLAVYTGNVVSALSQVVFNDQYVDSDQSKVSLGLLSGTTYWIAVDGYNGDVGNAVLRWSVPNVNNLLGSDNFADALLIAGSSGVTDATDMSAFTAEPGEPFHAGYYREHTGWWRYTASANGDLLLDTSNSTSSAILGVYTGSAVSELTEVASDEGDVSVFQGRVQFRVFQGETYWIAIDGFDDVVLSWAFLHKTSGNDNFVDATPISGSSRLSDPTDMPSATPELGEPMDGSLYADYYTAWWKYTARTSGVLEISTWRSDDEFDTNLGVYTGDAVTNLTGVVYNNDDWESDGSEVCLSVLLGETYWVKVGVYACYGGRNAILSWDLNTGDYDGDGMSNAEEQIADTDPIDFEDKFCITGIEGTTVHFKSSDARRYTLYGCTNLTEGTWSPVAPEQMGSGGSDSLTGTNTAPAQFYKVGVSLL